MTRIPRIDNFEASVPTAPRDLRTGDRVATGWNTYDIVVAVTNTKTGANVWLRHPGSRDAYKVHRVSPVPVIRD